jgi:excisionase family DNA binding protein
MEREPDEAGRSAVERLTVTVTQAAVMLGISRTSAYERVRRDEIPTVRLGRRLLVPKARLLAMLDGDSADSATTEEEAA